MAKSSGSILSVQLTQETDFLLARQRAKQIAALAGFDQQDQTRIATAVSEIARNAFEYGAGGRAEYFLDLPVGAATAKLRIVITDKGKGIPHLESIWSGTYESKTGMGLGLTGARRLLDELDVQTGPQGTVATLVKHLPRGVAEPPSHREIATHLSQHAPSSTASLRDQNQELVSLLSELRARESELQTLNQELEETNRGVLVLYAELEDKAQSVEQASEMKTRFLSGVTHELRTPLNSIVSLSRLLLAHADGELNFEQSKQVQFILQSAQNLTEMVNDLLDLAKIEAGKTSVKVTEFTVAELFAGLRGMFRPLALNEKVALRFETPAELTVLRSDEGKVSQILRNFISNALKFTESGTVTVSAQRVSAPAIATGYGGGAMAGGDGQVSGYISFAVADTGIGIAPEHAEIVMQEWGQVEEASHNRHKGSGLGLPLSRRLAELLGGYLNFTSTVGVGSTFRVTLPGLVSTPEAGLPPAPREKDATAPHILMVDDNEVSRYLLRRQLAAFTTAAVEEQISGEAGLESIRLRRPEILFLDLVMPGFSGMEVARQLRADAETRDLPIVLHTSKVLSGEERRMIEELDLTVIPKRGESQTTQGDEDDLRMRIERALLEVGLCNMHDAQAAS